MINVLSNQKEDGGFDHYIVFGKRAPWDADGKNVVKCGSEEDAFKLKGLIECNYKQPVINVTIPSMTSGNPLEVVVIKRCGVRAFFGMDSVKLNVYCQGFMSTGWGWSEGWYNPSDITGLV